ncbi:MAG: hypothetical protein AAFR59_03470, partial [Bacteroidota bacterium]
IWRKRWVQLMMTLGLTTSLARTNPAPAKHMTESHMGIMEWKDQKKKTFTYVGTVRAKENGKYLANVKVTLKDSEKVLAEGQTDRLGKFELEIPVDAPSSESLELIVTYLGSQFINRAISLRNQNLQISIRSEIYLEGVDIVASQSEGEPHFVGKIHVMSGIPVLNAPGVAPCSTVEQKDPIKELKKYGPHGQ